MRRKAIFLAAIAAVATAAGAFASALDTPGVSDSTILLGGTAPLSGEASAAAGVAKGAEAYFNYVNAHGGVVGRKVQYKYVDDAYDPAQTVQAVRGLVQQDNVFAIFNTLGTNNNLAIRDFLNQVKVPQLFAFGKFAIQALVYASKLGWHPQVYVNAVASSATLMRIATLTAGARETKGAISVVFFKDPTDPRWARDPGIRLFHAIMKQFAP